MEGFDWGGEGGRGWGEDEDVVGELEGWRLVGRFGGVELREEVFLEDLGAYCVEVGVVPGEEDLYGGGVGLVEDGDLPAWLVACDAGFWEVVIELGAKGLLDCLFKVVVIFEMVPFDMICQVETL